MADDATNKRVHFGAFLRMIREEKGWTLRDLSERTRMPEVGKKGISDKRLWELEQLAEPTSYAATLSRIAKAFGHSAEEFDRRWRSTPVVVPEKPAPLPADDGGTSSSYKLDDVIDRLRWLASQVAQASDAPKKIGAALTSDEVMAIIDILKQRLMPSMHEAEVFAGHPPNGKAPGIRAEGVEQRPKRKAAFDVGQRGVLPRPEGGSDADKPPPRKKP